MCVPGVEESEKKKVPPLRIISGTALKALYWGFLRVVTMTFELMTLLIISSKLKTA